MASSDGRQRAKELVQEIAEEHGYVGEETLQHITNPEARRKIETALHKKDVLGGLSIITHHLYSSKARFIFQLLQNADDNQYSRAAASGSVPFVSYRVFPDRIIIECNEDGFTHKNLTAICSVGQSSKTGAQGYIGEKGIGFKSIFMVAWKAHIQSEAFSFTLRHKKGESGMGMISPVWEETGEVLESPLTRITLYLHNTENSNAVAETPEAIRTQFDELQETVLLFLKKIRRINVEFYDNNGKQTTSVTHVRTAQFQPDRVKLESIFTTNGRPQKRIKHFHVTRVSATKLEKNDNRTYSEAEEAAKAYSFSEVVVAFPLSEASVPIVEPQEIFAFLPVRPAGFNFIIQADFVTNANRQDIVKDSLRNVGLLHAVGEAFVSAVIQFQAYETLRYRWVQFLPDRQNGSWDPFWLGLVEKITTLLRSAPVFYDHKGFVPRTVKELFRVAFDGLDEHGDPLFDDGNPAQVISRRYSQTELHVLGSYGLRHADHLRIVDWLRADLRTAKSSRMKSPDTPESWHERAANFLDAAFVKKVHRITAELVNLDLIPLEDGSWASASSGPIYFAQADGLNVPTDVGLRILSRRVTNNQRTLLFKSLGVTTAQLRMVRRQILQSYRTDTHPDFTIEASKDHLKFLYGTENLAGGEFPYEAIAIFNHRGDSQRPSQQIMYLANDDTHGAMEVFKATSPGLNPGDGAIGYCWSNGEEEGLLNVRVIGKRKDY
ncbi:INO80 chromatin remodeling complex protein [Colletotrichum tofieldiae]|nr:INO80 chromatin remodeling complex protein [Colletotrichum tofieldiae]